MLLKCEYSFVNRHQPSLESKKCHATIVFSKKVKDSSCGEDVSFIVCTAKNKNGQKFKVKGNIERMFTRFVQDGKCTLCLTDPPYDIIISKAPVDMLKKFLTIIKVVCKGESTSFLLDNITLNPKNIDLKKPQSTMRIISRDQYPIKSTFPRSLTKLIITTCALKAFDSRILKLTLLVTLDLSSNKLAELCDTIDSLVSLKCVYLQDNKFTHIPHCLYRGTVSKQIQLLDISKNSISVLPGKFTSMTNLVTLKLHENKLEYLPANFGVLSKLESLSLNGNRLKFLPWSFRNMRFNSLDLSENNFTTSLEINQPVLTDKLLPLFETTSRYIIKKRIPYDALPFRLKQHLDQVKYCYCGSPCFSNVIPFTELFNVNNVSSSNVYDSSVSNPPHIIGYFCSMACQAKWISRNNK